MTTTYDLDRVVENLSVQLDGASLEVKPPDANGSVRIVCHEAFKSWRYTAQGRLVAEPRSAMEKRS